MVNEDLIDNQPQDIPALLLGQVVQTVAELPGPQNQVLHEEALLRRHRLPGAEVVQCGTSGFQSLGDEAPLLVELSNTLEADFCVDALKEALEQGQPEVFNTDQGSQFTSLEFTHVLQEQGVKISMDGKGRYTDNIFVERLWRTVKYEEVYLKAYANASEARRELGAYLRFYNDQRPHQALGYRTPAEVFHQVTDVGEEGAVQAKESPIAQTLVSLAGAAGLSPNSTAILSN